MTKKAFTPAIDCTNEQRPSISLTPVTSNQIKAVGYDEATKTLAITFTHGPGNVYLYDGVEPEQHEAFLKAESLGKHFGEHIQILPSKKYAPNPVAAATDTAQAAA